MIKRLNVVSQAWCVIALLVIALCSSGCQATTPQVTRAPTFTAVASATSPPPSPAADTQVSPTPMSILEQNTILVPQGNPPAIDGVIEKEEWESAVKDLAADGSEVMFVHAEGALYVGIRGSTPEMIVGNVFIAEGDTIRILHASAALGTAVYKRGDDGWDQTQTFVWRCRGTSNSANALTERASFLQDEGWVATNSRIGTPNEHEFMIILPAEPMRLAVNILRSSTPDEKVPYPAGLDDGVIAPTPGGLPAVISFAPEGWVLVTLLPVE